MVNETEKGHNRKTDIRPTSDSNWFAKLKAEPLSDKTNQEFLDWLEENPENEQQYERCELAWDLAEELEQDAEIASLIRECDERIAQSKHRKQSENRSNFLQGLRELFAAPKAKIGAFAFACAAVISVFVLQMPQTYQTGIGEQLVVALADGSTITLNTDTELRVNFTKDHRGIELQRGEAVFEVAHDANRPFDVFAANGMARAVGTRFNVAMEQGQVTVSVLEGVVEVRAGVDRETPGQGVEDLNSRNRSALLKIGQAVNYWQEGAIAEPHKARINRINAWQKGKLAFDADPLQEVIKEHNRYSSQKIVISRDQLKSIEVSGVFNAGDTEALLYALQETFGIRALHRNNLIMLVPKT